MDKQVFYVKAVGEASLFSRKPDTVQWPFSELLNRKLNINWMSWKRAGGEKYPIVLGLWRNNWEKLSIYFGYPAAIRHLIYTTHAI